MAFLPKICQISGLKSHNSARLCRTAHIRRIIFLLNSLVDEFNARGERLEYWRRAPDKGEVGGSSPPRPTISFNQLAAVAFRTVGDCAQFCAPAPSKVGFAIASMAARLASMRMCE
jgi:hypothetical protein